jgi:hypothetical protein
VYSAKKRLKLRTNMSPPSSGSNNTSSKKPACSSFQVLLHADSSLGLFFVPESAPPKRRLLSTDVMSQEIELIKEKELSKSRHVPRTAEPNQRSVVPALLKTSFQNPCILWKKCSVEWVAMVVSGTDVTCTSCCRYEF